MHQITENTTIGELCGYEEYRPVSDYFFTNMTEDVWKNPLKHYGYEKCGFEEALERVKTILAEKIPMVYDVGAEEVKLIYMPAIGENADNKADGTADENADNKAGGSLPYVVVCPGGAYARQWGLIEGIAVGSVWNRLGYPAFILYYRTAQKPLLPKPIDDLAAAIRLIEERAEEFRVEKGNYAVAGFSAGGHLAAEWGTTNHGWSHYGLAKPGALFLAYPSSSNDVFCDALEQAKAAGASEAQMASGRNYLERVGGPDFTRESLREYSIEYHMDDSYPPVYLLACKDDPVVPIESSYVLLKALEDHHIPHQSRIAETGGHSFGVGNHTQMHGWLEEAAGFWETQRGRNQEAGDGKN